MGCCLGQRGGVGCCLGQMGGWGVVWVRGLGGCCVRWRGEVQGPGEGGRGGKASLGLTLRIPICLKAEEKCLLGTLILSSLQNTRG